MTAIKGFILNCLVWAMMLSVSPAHAQGFPVFQDPLPVASIDQDRLFRESEFGQSVLADIDARSIRLSSENRLIESQLEQEELELTARRSEMNPDAFNALAVAFDTKVKRIRAEQDQKLRAIRSSLDDGRLEFGRKLTPILQRYMADNEIQFILDSAAIILSSSRGDITDIIVELVDAEFDND